MERVHWNKHSVRRLWLVDCSIDISIGGRQAVRPMGGRHNGITHRGIESMIKMNQEGLTDISRYMRSTDGGTGSDCRWESPGRMIAKLGRRQFGMFCCYVVQSKQVSKIGRFSVVVGVNTHLVGMLSSHNLSIGWTQPATCPRNVSVGGNLLARSTSHDKTSHETCHYRIAIPVLCLSF